MRKGDAGRQKKREVGAREGSYRNRIALFITPAGAFCFRPARKYESFRQFRLLTRYPTDVCTRIVFRRRFFVSCRPPVRSSHHAVHPLSSPSPHPGWRLSFPEPLPSSTSCPPQQCTESSVNFWFVYQKRVLSSPVPRDSRPSFNPFAP